MPSYSASCSRLKILNSLTRLVGCVRCKSYYSARRSHTNLCFSRATPDLFSVRRLHAPAHADLTSSADLPYLVSNVLQNATDFRSQSALGCSTTPTAAIRGARSRPRTSRRNPPPRTSCVLAPPISLISPDRRTRSPGAAARTHRRAQTRSRTAVPWAR